MSPEINLHYEKTHQDELVGGEKIVTKTIVQDPKDWDISPEETKDITDSDGFIRYTLSRIPIFHKRLSLIEATSYRPKQETQTGEPATVIFIGGGSSSARVTTGAETSRLIAALDHAYQANSDAKLNIKNIITLSHPSGAPGSQEKIDQESLGDSATILNQALDKLTHSQNIVLVGFSAGSALATQLAEKLGDRCHSLTLIEPAGMADYNIAKGAIKDSTINTFKKYRQQGLNPVSALRKSLQEFRVSWSSETGVPNLLTVFKELAGAKPPLHDTISDIYGIEKPAKPGPNMDLLSTDATQSAREQITCPVTIATISEAQTVSLSPKDQPYTQELHQELVEALFPDSAQKTSILHPGQTHATVLTDQSLWESISQNLINS